MLYALAHRRRLSLALPLAQMPAGCSLSAPDRPARSMQSSRRAAIALKGVANMLTPLGRRLFCLHAAGALWQLSGGGPETCPCWLLPLQVCLWWRVPRRYRRPEPAATGGTLLRRAGRQTKGAGPHGLC